MAAALSVGLRAPKPKASRWRGKAVTKADYQALCLAFPGVAKAQVLDLNDDGTLRIYTVRVVVAPDGGGAPSPQLKADLRAYLEARRMVTIDIRLTSKRRRRRPYWSKLNCCVRVGHRGKAHQDRAVTVSNTIHGDSVRPWENRYATSYVSNR